MHELSIALEVCRIAHEQAGDAASNVIAVGVDVGDASGFEVDNLEFCLDALLSQPPFGRAKSRIRRQPGDVLRLTWLEIEDDHPQDRDS